MVVRELIAKIAYELDKNSVNKADNSINKTKSKLSKIANVGSNAWNKISNSANKTRISINGIGKEAIYTSEQLRRMGAYQDKLGRWHGSNGKYLKINADTTQARANILSLQSSMHSLINGARMLGQAIIVAFAIDRIIAFTQAIQKSADEMMNLDGRLRTITSTDEERFNIEDRLYVLSQQNRQGMKEMGNLYFKIANGTKKYGFNTEDFMRATDIVSKSLTIGGASTAEAQSTILQLGQALGSGFLMGDELNSLNENAQPLMQKIAEYFGKDIGELKEMGSERELKSEDIMRAILSAGAKMDEEFSKMPTTIGQSLQQIENLWNRFTQRLERGTGVFSFIAKSMSNNVMYISNIVNDLFTLMDDYDGSQEWLDRFQDSYPILFTLYEGFSSLKDIVMDIVEAFKPFTNELNNFDIYDIFFGIKNALQEIFSGLLPTIEPFLQAIARLASDILPLLKNSFITIAPLIATGFAIIASILGSIIEIFTSIINFIADLIEENQEFAQLLVNIGVIILTYIYGGFIAVAGAIGFVIQAIQWCYEQLIILKNIIVESLYNAFIYALQAVSLFFSSIAQFFGNFIAETFIAVGQFISAFGNAINSVKNFFSGLGSFAISILQQIANAIQNWVLDKIEWASSKLNSLQSFADTVLDGIGNAVSSASYEYTMNNNFNVKNSDEAVSVVSGLDFPPLYPGD